MSRATFVMGGIDLATSLVGECRDDGDRMVYCRGTIEWISPCPTWWRTVARIFYTVDLVGARNVDHGIVDDAMF